MKDMTNPTEEMWMKKWFIVLFLSIVIIKMI